MSAKNLSDRVNMNLFDDVVMRLVGSVRATGCHATDEIRYENLQVFAMLAEDVVWELIKTSKTKDDYRISMKKIGTYAEKTLLDIHKMIEEELNENKDN